MTLLRLQVPPNSAQSAGSSGSTTSSQPDQHHHILGRQVLSHAWDAKEDNFLVCQTRPILNAGDTANAGVASAAAASDSCTDLYVSMFFHDDDGLIVHDSTTSEANGRLVGIQLPFVYVLNDEIQAEDGNSGY